jgi:hypothetical protein
VKAAGITIVPDERIVANAERRIDAKPDRTATDRRLSGHHHGKRGARDYTRIGIE